MSDADNEAAMDGANKTVRHHPDVQFREVDADIFLVHPDGVTIYNLNPTAAAIWRLMDHAMSGAEMTDVLAAAFPTMSAQRLRTDVHAILGELVAQGFALKD